MEVPPDFIKSYMIVTEWEYHLKQRRDRQAREEYVYDEGHEAGLTEGQEQKAIEVARNLTGVLEPDIIAEKTGLPLEKILELENENK